MIIKLLILLLICSCGSMPKTINEYKIMARENDNVFFPHKKLNLKPNVTMAEMKIRMEKYAKKCLSIQVRGETENTFGGNSLAYKGTYHPTLIQEKNELSLVLQRECTWGCAENNGPKGGDWIAISEVFKDENGNITGYSAAPSVNYGNLLKDSVGWLEGTSFVCPKLP